MTPATDPIVQQYNALIEWYLLNMPHMVLSIALLEKQRDNYIAEIYPTATAQ